MRDPVMSTDFRVQGVTKKRAENAGLVVVENVTVAWELQRDRYSAAVGSRSATHST